MDLLAELSSVTWSREGGPVRREDRRTDPRQMRTFGEVVGRAECIALAPVFHDDFESLIVSGG